MTSFQVIASVVFVLLLGVVYSREVLAALRGLVARAGGLVVVPETKSGAYTPKQRVSDLVTVAELRDRLAAANCQTGVEACTLLLRSMVDHTGC